MMIVTEPSTPLNDADHVEPFNSKFDIVYGNGSNILLWLSFIFLKVFAQ